MRPLLAGFERPLTALAGGTRHRASAHERQIAELERQIESRNQVIGELTIANRALKKLSARSC
jgi:hypothetical protein